MKPAKILALLLTYISLSIWCVLSCNAQEADPDFQLDNIDAPAPIQNGVHKIYYPNGTIYQEVPYIDGLISGTGTIYRKDGSILVKLLYSKNQPNGMWYYYNKDGTVKRTVLYENGEMVMQVRKPANSNLQNVNIYSSKRDSVKIE